MQKITVPPGFAETTVRREGAAGRQWIDHLPALAAKWCDRWELRPDGGVWHGVCALVVGVRCADGSPAALKFSWPHHEGEHEALALSTWDQSRVVRVLAYDHADRALLLERLHSGESLLAAPPAEALAVTGGLLRALGGPAPAAVRTLTATAARWSAELAATAPGHVPQSLVDTAAALCRELGPGAGNDLVNEDLHYANILRGDRAPWLLIDPMPIAGDREFSVIPLLWNRFEETGTVAAVRGRFDELVEIGALDHDRARAWTLVRAVENWLGCAPGDELPSRLSLATIAAAVAW